MEKLKEVDLIMHVSGTLSDFPANMSTEDLHVQMWSHVNSKYSNQYDLKVSKERILSEGIACLANVGGDVTITFYNLKDRSYNIPSLEQTHELRGKYKDTESFEIKETDLIMFPTNIKYDIKGAGARLSIFKVEESEGFGDGPNKYRVELTFSDTYYLIVNASNGDEAKDIAYETNMSYWIHEWPSVEGLEKIHAVRSSRWGRKMLKSFRV